METEIIIKNFRRSDSECTTFPNWLDEHEHVIQSEFKRTNNSNLKSILNSVFIKIIDIKLISKRITDNLTKSLGSPPNIAFYLFARGVMANENSREAVFNSYKRMQTELDTFKTGVERCKQSFENNFFHGQLLEINSYIGRLATFSQSDPSKESSISEKKEEVGNRILKPLKYFNDNKEALIGAAIRCVERIIPTYRAIRSREHENLKHLIDPNYKM